MQRAPSVLMVLEGRKVVDVVRKLAGVTEGTEAMPGTIRGDFSLSVQNTIIHASDSKEAAKKEIKRFFKDAEIYDYPKVDSEVIYSDTEKE